MSVSHSDASNGFIAAISGLPAYFVALVEPTQISTVITAIALPCIFFFLGKTVDVIVRLYLEKRKK